MHKIEKNLIVPIPKDFSLSTPSTSPSLNQARPSPAPIQYKAGFDFSKSITPLWNPFADPGAFTPGVFPLGFVGTYPLTPVLSTENSTTTMTQKKRKTPDSRSDSSAALPNFAIRQTLSTTPGAQSVPALTVTGMRTNHQEIKQKRHYCNFPQCGKDFSRKFTLNRHQELHTNREKFCCNFPGCDREYWQKRNLKHHKKVMRHKKVYKNLNSLSTQTSSSRPVNDSDLTPSSLNPAKELHTNRKRFCCDFPGCDKKYGTKRISKNHNELKHQKQGRFACDFPECDRDFAYKFNLNRHKKLHTNRKKFCCNFPGCDKKYLHKQNLGDHKEVKHQNKRFCCDVPGCDRKHTTTNYLKTHQKNVHKNLNSLPTEGTKSIGALRSSPQKKRKTPDSRSGSLSDIVSPEIEALRILRSALKFLKKFVMTSLLKLTYLRIFFHPSHLFH